MGNSGIRNKAGFTLLETLIIAAIVAVMVMGIAAYYYQRARIEEARRVSKSVAQMKENITSKASTAATIRASADMDACHLTPRPAGCPQ